MQDLLLDNNFELQIADGDLVIGDAVSQNQGLIIISQPGEWKEHPALGVGIESWLNDESPGDLKTQIRKQLKADGMKVNAISFADGQLNIDADYE